MCLRPNRRASIDHAPGPIMAKVAPMTAKMTDTLGSLALDHTLHALAVATTVPAIGVHRPNSKNAPATAPTVCGTICAHAVGPDRQLIT
jgi:hypothetical protein